MKSGTLRSALFEHEALSMRDALCQARLGIMACYPHPRCWAASELMGDWR
jgi:hypothetical protein